MMSGIIGVFRSEAKMWQAYESLGEDGFDKENLSVITQVDKGRSTRPVVTREEGMEGARRNPTPRETIRAHEVDGIWQPWPSQAQMGTYPNSSYGTLLSGSEAEREEDSDHNLDSTRDGISLGAGIGASLVLLGGALFPPLGLAAFGPVASALVGATAGGLVGGFVDWGLPAERADGLRERLQAGEYLIVVETHDPQHRAQAHQAMQGLADDVVIWD